MKIMRINSFVVLLGILVVWLSGGCSSYVTPTAGVQLKSIPADYSDEGIVDGDIKTRLETKPASPFPARIAVVRIQAPDYKSNGQTGYGTGRYSIVTTRDIETEADFAKLEGMTMVSGVAFVNRLILPPRTDTIKDLRVAVSSLHADMLLIYTIDTSFNIQGEDIGPLGIVSLGFAPSRKAIVTSTASAAIFDVRTGYLYGLSEATAQEDQQTSIWSTKEVVESIRLETETKAFVKLIVDLEKTWKGIVENYN